jgi:hypothetical protein
MSRDLIERVVAGVMERVSMPRDYDVMEADGRWIVHLFSYFGKEPVMTGFTVYPTWDEHDVELETRERLLSLVQFETRVELDRLNVEVF